VRGVIHDLLVFLSHFDRTEVETVIHSDNGFATVAYLRIKEATLEEKPESGVDLIVPPLLDADFSRVQTILRGHQSPDTSIRAVSEPDIRKSAGPSCGPSHSRRGNWVAVGNVQYVTSQAITFEEEVTQCFREIQGSLLSIEGITP
jgi:diphthine-ammonia ligase